MTSLRQSFLSFLFTFFFNLWLVFLFVCFVVVWVFIASVCFLFVCLLVGNHSVSPVRVRWPGTVFKPSCLDCQIITRNTEDLKIIQTPEQRGSRNAACVCLVQSGSIIITQTRPWAVSGRGLLGSSKSEQRERESALHAHVLKSAT